MNRLEMNQLPPHHREHLQHTGEFFDDSSQRIRRDGDGETQLVSAGICERRADGVQLVAAIAGERKSLLGSQRLEKGVAFPGFDQRLQLMVKPLERLGAQRRVERAAESAGAQLEPRVQPIAVKKVGGGRIGSAEDAHEEKVATCRRNTDRSDG